MTVIDQFQLVVTWVSCPQGTFIDLLITEGNLQAFWNKHADRHTHK